MNTLSRRQMIAATAAGGLLTTTASVNAQPGPFQPKPGDGGFGHQVSELRRLGLVDIATNSVLVPTESGRQSYRLCAARGHGKHLER